MIYFVLSQSSKQYAAQVSRLLYTLSRPESVRESKDTEYWCGWLIHPTSGEVALRLPGENMPIHTDATAEKLIELMQDATTPEERQSIRDALRERKGKRAAPTNFVPDSLVSQQLTQEEAEDAGWFAEQAR